MSYCILNISKLFIISLQINEFPKILFFQKKGVETCSSDRSFNHKMASQMKYRAGNMYLILKKCLQNMIYFANKEIFSGNNPLNFMEKRGYYAFFGK